MRVRGERECRDCGGRWSYYGTGSVACPDCGSLRSVGVGERRRHTDAPVDLDLTDHRAALSDGSIREVADDLASTLRAYLRRRGFVDAGAVRAPDGTELAAAELLHAVDAYGGLRDPDGAAEAHVLALLRGADAGERPAPEAVPEAMWDARGRGYAHLLRAFRREAAATLDGDDLDDDTEAAARRALGALDDRVRRLRALEGDLPPAAVERLVAAARDVAAALGPDGGDADALRAVADRLERPTD